MDQFRDFLKVNQTPQKEAKNDTKQLRFDTKQLRFAHDN